MIYTKVNKRQNLAEIYNTKVQKNNWMNLPRYCRSGNYNYSSLV